jgi:hypothetical protein
MLSGVICPGFVFAAMAFTVQLLLLSYRPKVLPGSSHSQLLHSLMRLCNVALADHEITCLRICTAVHEIDSTNTHHSMLLLLSLQPGAQPLCQACRRLHELTADRCARTLVTRASTTTFLRQWLRWCGTWVGPTQP